MVENLQHLFERLRTYSPVEVVIELAIIWVVLYLIIRFLRGTRGAGIIKGLALLLIAATLAVQVLGGEDNQSFQRLTYLYNRSLAFLALGFLVIFQPELRRALIKLGETSFFRRSRRDLAPVIDSVVEACGFLARNQIGAIIVFERKIGLGGIIEGGTLLDAKVSASLLQTIFWPNSALHDLGVIIRGDRILAAGVQLPMAEQWRGGKQFGSRHRAAVGVTLESDALAIVVSEERGEIRLAFEGGLSAEMTPRILRHVLLERLMETTGVSSSTSTAAEMKSEIAEEPANAFDLAEEEVLATDTSTTPAPRSAESLTKESNS